ncbi:hypothetical protein BCV69DRAFT_282252 [Microstroma glucosiphilum]|uniref:Uncharacterized protein n=1 Tax=Pseudomicrostroma glucosiphilum TaxID=1684307 RepID=A0A316UAN6_9BASI|nr:hypothetical protein BCV69DRAFT_282252 [Pseudomicrostroma glucosiphilum]PWN21531.1 hypothetical protein BCV69DRAFT_282252 [Pseudomicrostroma glucosiphilum]
MTTAASRNSSDMATEVGVRRKSASSGSGRGKMNALNPSFGMTSNAEAGSSRSPPLVSHDRRPSRDSLKPSAKSHKSSDRLHRLGAASGSTSHLASKRSKSQTHLATQTPAPAKSKKETTSGKNRRQKDGEEGEDDDEEGWTSASAAGTPDQSLQASPKESDEEDEDGGVVLKMGGKKKPGLSVQTKASTVEFPSQKGSDGGQSLESTSRQQAQEEPKTPTAVSQTHPPHLTTASRTDSEATLGKNSQHEDDEAAGQSGEGAAGRDEYLAPLGGDKPRPHSLATNQRMPTSSSSKTLTEGGPGSFYASGGRGVSSASIASRMSSRSRTISLLPQIQHTAPPMLSTHNALAGSLGALHEGQSDMPLSKSPSSVSLHGFASGAGRNNTRDSWAESSSRAHGRKASISSQSSNLTLPNMRDAASSKKGDETPLKGISAADAMLAPGVWERRRVQSTSSNHNSLTAADAAKLAAKLRQARDAMDDAQGGRGAGHASGGASRGGIAALANATTDGKYTKPIISTFAKDPDRKWSPHAVPVTARSIYAPGYTKIQSKTGKAVARGKDPLRSIRYVANYGLGGPPIAQTALNEALLAPSFDGDEFEASWAPALANAAGLGSRSSRLGGHSSSSSNFREDGIPLHDPGMAFTGSAAVNGPNATPVHLIHGLTTISPEPFPLDPADAPSLAVDEQHALTADPGTLRAIALTSQVLSTHRSHTMTRRYFDPMREALGRIATHKTGGVSGTAGNLGVGQTGSATPPANHAPGVHALRRQNTSSRGSLEASENPVQSLRRVWSGRGNLSSAPGSASGSGRSAR